MHIQSINNSNPNFNGSYKFKGAWTVAMREVAEPFVQELAKGDKTIIAKMSTRRAFFDRFHRFGQKLYRPTIIAKKENLSLWQNIKDKLGLLSINKIDVTEHYHRHRSLERLLKERLNASNYNIKNYCWRLNIQK